jgi:hypothetical protein
LTLHQHGIKFKKISVIGKSVVKANCISEDGNKNTLVRWEQGRGWREAGSGYGSDKSKVYYPIIGNFKYNDKDYSYFIGILCYSLIPIRCI